MAAPNLVNVSSIYGRTHAQAVTTGAVDVLSCAAEKVLKINTIQVANIDGTNDAWVTVIFQDNSQSSTDFNLGYHINVVAQNSVIVVSKDNPIYLEESDKIRVLGEAASDLEVTVSYEEMDDA